MGKTQYTFPALQRSRAPSLDQRGKKIKFESTATTHEVEGGKGDYFQEEDRQEKCLQALTRWTFAV